MKLRKFMKLVPIAMVATILAQAGEVKADSSYVVATESEDVASVASSYTGMKKVNGAWCYLVNGQVATSYTGLVKYNSKWVFVYKGQLNTTYTGLVKHKNSWVYVKKGKLDASYTGMVKYKNSWVYVKKGKLDTTYTGLAKNKYGWWHMSNGKLDLTYTGLSKNQYGWWHVTDGKLDTSYTGISSNKYGKWYVVNGRLDTSFSGQIKIGEITYTIKKGLVVAESKEATEGKITLGEYKGIKVDSSLAEVSEEDIQSYLDSLLQIYAIENEVTGVTFAEDDVAKLDYVCIIDGEEYDSATDIQVELNEYGFDMNGFVDSIIGRKTGDEYEFTITLEDDFYDEEMVGKEATFKITLHAKIETVIPEFTDEFVAKNFDYLELKTKEDLLKNFESDFIRNNVFYDIWDNVIIDSARVESYDSQKLEAWIEWCLAYQEELLNSYGYTLDEYLEIMGQTKEAFLNETRELAKAALKEEMVVNAIAELEGIVLTESIYQKYMMIISKTYGFDSVEELMKEFEPFMTQEDFERAILAELVQKFVCENVEFVEGFGVRD